MSDHGLVNMEVVSHSGTGQVKRRGRTLGVLLTLHKPCPNRLRDAVLQAAEQSLGTDWRSFYNPDDPVWVETPNAWHLMACNESTYYKTPLQEIP